MKDLWKKFAGGLCIAGTLGIMGCSPSANTETADYLRCNATSNGNMAETESGFFYAVNGILYYADKDDMSKWIEVCNKPNCKHERGDLSCHAYISANEFVQQNGHLYGIDLDIETRRPYVFEIKTDGSGLKHVYDIPVEENIWITGFRAMFSQEQLVIYYKYMEEDGTFRRNLARLEDDSIHILYTDRVEDENESILNMRGSSYWRIRGDDVMISSLLAGTDGNFFRSLWNVDGDKPERVNIPEDVSLLGAYLSGDTLTYFQENEGFYQVDLISGEKTLVFKNQLENSRGYILTEDYMIECNRYIDHMPEEPYLKFYNGEEWLNVTLPDEVKNSDDIFSILSVASDRIFIDQSTMTETEESSHLYYFMLEDEDPELIFCAEIGAESSLESEAGITEPSESYNEEDTSSAIIDSGIIDIEDIVVFETEDYLFKITSLEPDYGEGFRVNVYWENRSDQDEYMIRMNIAAVNGIFSTDGWSNRAMAPQTSDEGYIYFSDSMMGSNYKFEVDNIYNHDVSKYTDIEFYFEICDNKFKTIEDKVVNIYPYGKESVIKYEREAQSTDHVIVDNEYVTIIVTGYEQKEISNDTVNFYFVNKTDTRVFFVMDNIYVNNTLTPEYECWYIGAGQCVFASVVLNNLKEITDIEEIKLTPFYVQDAEAKDETGKVTGEIYFQEEVILNP